jgi:hypothetical protein
MKKKAFFSTRKETSIVGPTLLCPEHAGIVGRLGNIQEQAPSRFRNDSPITTSHSKAGVFVTSTYTSPLWPLNLSFSKCRRKAIRFPYVHANRIGSPSPPELHHNQLRHNGGFYSLKRGSTSCRKVGRSNPIQRNRKTVKITNPTLDQAPGTEINRDGYTINISIQIQSQLERRDWAWIIPLEKFDPD